MAETSKLNSLKTNFICVTCSARVNKNGLFCPQKQRTDSGRESIRRQATQYSGGSVDVGLVIEHDGPEAGAQVNAVGIPAFAPSPLATGEMARHLTQEAGADPTWPIRASSRPAAVDDRANSQGQLGGAAASVAAHHALFASSTAVPFKGIFEVPK